jgi:mitochondrial enoyl-[acyl-carrier protein] reductase / trans-2-enoyl-CoA reductase
MILQKSTVSFIRGNGKQLIRGKYPSLQVAVAQYHELSFRETGEPLDVLHYHCDDNDYSAHSPSSLDHGSHNTSSNTSKSDSQNASRPPRFFSSSPPSSSSSLYHVQLMAAPWNPADVNTVQGRYAQPYQLPGSTMDADWSHQIRASRIPGHTLAGSEGLGRIVQAPPNTGCGHDLQEGDWVVLGLPGLGSLRSEVHLPRTALLRIPDAVVHPLYRPWDIPTTAAYFSLAGTANRMLHDFVPPLTVDDSDIQLQGLQPGDVVIQNAGHSSMGRMVAQLLPADVTLISVVRRGMRSPEQMEALRNNILSLNPQAREVIVVAEEDWQDMEAFRAWQHDFFQQYARPRLALNAVGGESAERLWKLLGPQGTMVTYGGLSKQPFTLSTPSLIFQDKSCRGYWHSAWMASHSLHERQEMIDILADFIIKDQVKKPSVETFALRDWHDAMYFDNSQSNQAMKKKVVFSLKE